jgi:hypothetical protein
LLFSAFFLGVLGALAVHFVFDAIALGRAGQAIIKKRNEPPKRQGKTRTKERKSEVRARVAVFVFG